MGAMVIVMTFAISIQQLGIERNTNTNVQRKIQNELVLQ